MVEGYDKSLSYFTMDVSYPYAQGKDMSLSSIMAKGCVGHSSPISDFPVSNGAKKRKLQ